MSIVELRTAVLAKNDGLAAALRADLAAAGTVAVNLLSSPRPPEAILRSWC